MSFAVRPVPAEQIRMLRPPHPLDPHATHHLGAYAGGTLVAVLSAFPVDQRLRPAADVVLLHGPFGPRADAAAGDLLAALLGASRARTWWRERGAPEDAGASPREVRVVPGLLVVRERPGMFVGSTDGRGRLELLHELLSNVVDEVVAGHASRCDVRRDPDGLVTVEDDGRGIAVTERVHGRGRLDVMMTTLHTGPAFQRHTPHFHTSPLAAGLAVLNALSSRTEVEVRRDGRRWVQRFSRGLPTTDLMDEGPADGTGTRVSYRPDVEIFEGAPSDDTILEALQEVAELNPACSFSFQGEGIDADGGLAHMARRMGAAEVPLQLDVSDPPGRRVRMAVGWADEDRAVERTFANMLEVTSTPNSVLDLVQTALAPLRARGRVVVADVWLPEPTDSLRTKRVLDAPDLVVELGPALARRVRAFAASHPRWATLSAVPR